MNHRSSPRAARRTFLALSCIAPALAAPAQAQQQEQNLGSFAVTDSVVVEPTRKLESPKRTRPVRDTPQTITVLGRAEIEEQNLLTLRDVLSTVPGITFGAGEGGGGYGDAITFRGYSASNDITVDGVRDSAQYTRTDPFNLETIEITNGANSVVSGAGSVGGQINLVTKKPLAHNESVLSAGVGTADYYRATADINRTIGGQAAFRLNAMAHKNRVPGREVENYKRWGIAPALTFGLGTPTRYTLQYVHQEDTNVPQYGLPYYNGLVQGVSRSDYFGYRNVDRQRSVVNQATGIFEHDLGAKISLRNLARWQQVTQFTLVDPPQGTWCLTSTNLTPTGASCGTVPAGYYQPSGPRGNTRKSTNDLFFDQVDLKAVFNTGRIEHTIDLGAAISWEKFHLSSGSSLRNVDGTSPALPLMNIANPDNVAVGSNSALVYGSNTYTGPINYIESARQTGEQSNYAVYFFDTMKLGKVELNTGVRLEDNTGTYRADTVSTAAATLGAVTPGTTFRNSATLFSYRVGLVYKPVEPVSLYVAYGNSRTPSKASVNGSCSAATCNIDPESAKNYEIGVKAEVLGGLLLTASIFRNERDKYAVASNDPTIPDQQLNGKSRVDGITLGASGNVTPRLRMTANYTHLRGRLLQSVSNYCIANPSTTCGNSAANRNPLGGTALQNTPEDAGSIFATYRLFDGLTLGYGATYQGSFAFASPTYVAATNSLTPATRSQAYWVHQASLAYEINKRVSLQLNVKNFTDKLYFTRIRNNGWATPGDARSAVLTMNVKL
ncbi:catecholate siderophore receptor [Novosphingobium sp. SG751A]|uniref:TonB-dependent receptor n=1 Tax=Novosphingobium sp. SG751A TaxID=2587000 RepID=UPI001552476B|nr:TonB-dependent receptor [Novosphingobium sp. SG751A]NOW45101.1 catecholate siderophore receptor [Novosphingobium sp. SG751A]